MARVYIETTIPSFYHDTRRSAGIAAWRAATRAWWDTHRRRYELCTSELTIERKDGSRRADAHDTPVSDPGVGSMKVQRDARHSPDTVVNEVRATREKLWRSGGGTSAGFLALVRKLAKRRGARARRDRRSA